MEQARTSLRRCAAIEQALIAVRQRIGLARIGKGKIVGGIKMVSLLAPGAHRLAEANVQRQQAAADVWIGAVKDPSARFVAIEPEREEGTNHPAALRGAFDDGEVAGAVDRVCRSGFVLSRTFQEG